MEQKKPKRPKSACAYLEISAATLWRLVASGKLRAVKVSKRVTLIHGVEELANGGTN